MERGDDVSLDLLLEHPRPSKPNFLPLATSSYPAFRYMLIAATCPTVVSNVSVRNPNSLARSSSIDKHSCTETSSLKVGMHPHPAYLAADVRQAFESPHCDDATVD